ncbi:MAG: carbohydrate ABC transporter permease [Chloroflexi bacterium]|nr:carbohydrate ABC transporter permease [Chloroflexota bacterium]MCC6894961.1 carbohydrate ABC transporter permease [Anaerolineae bacterium]
MRSAVVTPRRSRPKIFIHLALIVICFIVGFPMIFTIIKSTQNLGQIMAYPPNLMPGDQIVQNYTAAWNTSNLVRLMSNTIVVAVAVTLGKTITSLLAGMAFVYFRFPLKGPLFIFVLLTLMMPTDILIVALFRLMGQLRWTNTLQALIVPFLASATGTLLFRQHFSNIPAELNDAAQIDGAGPFRYLRSILIPLSWNVIGALAMIQFIGVWNQYLWPLLIINDNQRQLVQVALKGITVNALDAGNWGVALAAAVIASIPPLIMFLALQESFLRGFTLTREK